MVRLWKFDIFLTKPLQNFPAWARGKR